jgi:transcriptional regulator with XRE-family HTH domain
MAKRKKSKQVHEELERIREHLCSHIAESGFSQRTLAHRIGMSRSGLTSMLKTEGSGIKMERLFKILQTIGMPKERFFGTLYGFSTADLEAQVASLTSTLLRLGVVTKGQLLNAIALHTGETGTAPIEEEVDNATNIRMNVEYLTLVGANIGLLNVDTIMSTNPKEVLLTLHAAAQAMECAQVLPDLDEVAVVTLLPPNDENRRQTIEQIRRDYASALHDLRERELSQSDQEEQEPS